MTSTITDRIYGESSGVAVKAPVSAVAAAPVTLNGLQTIGGVNLIEGNRVLVTAQADPTANGIYNVSAGAWQRTGDFDGAYDAVSGTLIVVNLPGPIPPGLLYQLSTPDPVLIGSSSLAFSQVTLPASATNFVGAANDGQNIYFHRTANYAGGTPGFVNSVLRTQTDVTSAGAGPFEWTFTSVMNNSSATGEQVAIYGQGNRLTSAAGATWAGVFEYRDLSGQANPNVGCVGVEIDLRASGTDANGARVGSDLVVTRYPMNTGAAMQAYCGYRVQNGGDNSAMPLNCYAIQSSVFGNGFTIFQGSTGTWGLNFGQATLTSGAALLPAGAPICFDANAASALYWDGTGLRFDYGIGARTACARLNDDGSIAFGGVTLPVKLNGATAATGTAGGGQAMPATVLGYLTGNVSGTTIKIPYVAN